MSEETEAEKGTQERHCFLCCQLTDGSAGNQWDTNHAEVGTRQLQSLFRYLDMDRENIPEIINGSRSSSISICKACSKILEQFSALFPVWEEMDMKLTLLCVEPLAKRLGKAFTGEDKNMYQKENLKQKCELSM